MDSFKTLIEYHPEREQWLQSAIVMFTRLMKIKINLKFKLAEPSSSSSSCGDIWCVNVPLAPIPVLFASLVYLFSSKKKTQRTHALAQVSKPANNNEESNNEMALEADAKYAKDLHACEICFEEHEGEMFKNSTCSHSICYECTTKHATTKIQEKNITVTCPGINCKSILNFNTLRLIISKETLVKWDEILCESMIPESHKLYCPFSNCSVMLINDDINNNCTEVKCPLCRRSFCASCRVPWHKKLSCKELRMQKEDKDDETVLELAKKMKWKRCPKCRFIVEKKEGCSIITCRCKYKFCYNRGED